MKTILFDVDGVLIFGYGANEKHRNPWDKNLEQDFGINSDAFKEQFIFKKFVNEVIVGKCDLHDALGEVLPSLGYHDNPQHIIDYWLKNDSNVNQHLLEQVKKLKASGKVRLFLATNQEHNRATYLMNELGFGEYFEDVFHSARIGAQKPNPFYYDRVTELLDVPPKDITFFDDCVEVVEGANKKGWNAHHYWDVEDIYKDTFVKSLLEKKT